MTAFDRLLVVGLWVMVAVLAVVLLGVRDDVRYLKRDVTDAPSCFTQSQHDGVFESASVDCEEKP